MKNLSKAHMKTINRDLKDDIAFSYSTYLFLKEEAKKKALGRSHTRDRLKRNLTMGRN
ncbi:hypothetical protein OE903_17755 [Bacillus sp. B6(2022)]|nr:hypothetical protein [Bacillus sp. B6(2022)]